MPNTTYIFPKIAQLFPIILLYLLQFVRLAREEDMEFLNDHYDDLSEELHEVVCNDE